MCHLQAACGAEGAGDGEERGPEGQSRTKQGILVAQSAANYILQRKNFDSLDSRDQRLTMCLITGSWLVAAVCRPPNTQNQNGLQKYLFQ